VRGRLSGWRHPIIGCSVLVAGSRAEATGSGSRLAYAKLVKAAAAAAPHEALVGKRTDDLEFAEGPVRGQRAGERVRGEAIVSYVLTA
jgi:hypothetical protein